jgi:hypothetical protein
MLPRLFAGQTTVFIPGADNFLKVPLGPVTGKITQSADFAANGLCFLHSASCSGIRTISAS